MAKYIIVVDVADGDSGYPSNQALLEDCLDDVDGLVSVVSIEEAPSQFGHSL